LSFAFAISGVSFRLLSALGLFPRNAVGKRTVAAVFVAFVAGCGGASEGPAVQTVTASAYRFEAPGGWKVTRTAAATTAARGDELVSVTIFRLPRPFRPALWDRAIPELDRVAGQLAGELDGRVTAKVATVVAGKRARQYDIAFTRNGTKLVERIAFLFEGRREYQLLCRYADDDSSCKAFVASFRQA
jgi:hypothetical protein